MLSGLRNINEGGGDHVVARAVALPRRVDAFDVGGVDLPSAAGVSRIMWPPRSTMPASCARWPGVRRGDPLPRQEDRVDDGRVRLRAAPTRKYTSASGAWQASRIRLQARSQCSVLP